MVDAYRDAFLLRSSAANRRSVVDHIEDIADLLPDVPIRDELRTAVATLRKLEPPDGSDRRCRAGRPRTGGAAP